jgi:hypothetical protein
MVLDTGVVPYLNIILDRSPGPDLVEQTREKLSYYRRTPTIKKKNRQAFTVNRFSSVFMSLGLLVQLGSLNLRPISILESFFALPIGASL